MAAEEFMCPGHYTVAVTRKMFSFLFFCFQTVAIIPDQIQFHLALDCVDVDHETTKEWHSYQTMCVRKRLTTNRFTLCAGQQRIEMMINNNNPTTNRHVYDSNLGSFFRRPISRRAVAHLAFRLFSD